MRDEADLLIATLIRLSLLGEPASEVFLIDTLED